MNSRHDLSYLHDFHRSLASIQNDALLQSRSGRSLEIDAKHEFGDFLLGNIHLDACYSDTTQLPTALVDQDQ